MLIVFCFGVVSAEKVQVREEQQNKNITKSDDTQKSFSQKYFGWLSISFLIIIGIILLPIVALGVIFITLYKWYSERVRCLIRMKSGTNILRNLKPVGENVIFNNEQYYLNNKKSETFKGIFASQPFYKYKEGNPEPLDYNLKEQQSHLSGLYYGLQQENFLKNIVKMMGMGTDTLTMINTVLLGLAVIGIVLVGGKMFGLF